MNIKEPISIVIPAHNEEKNLGRLVLAVDKLRKKQKWDCEMVIVNDNSQDSTEKLAEQFSKKYSKIKVIHRKKGNNGMGHALKAGTRKARGKYVIWTMGDNSDDINTYPKMIKKLNEGYDLVFGSRYSKGGSRGDAGLFKTILSAGYSMVCRIVFGTKVNDLTNAFRAFRKKVFDSLDLESGDFAISPEFSVKAQLKGYRLGEVPTRYENRKEGKASFNIRKMGARYLKIFKYRFIKV